MFRFKDLCVIICVTSFTAPLSWALPPGVFFKEKWNQTFHLRPIESGDTLAVGGVFCNGSEVFVYDEAAGAVVVLDSAGNIASVVQLEAAQRNAYYGDDFATVAEQFIFLNTVDKRLDYFDRFSGKHRTRVALPLEVLAGQRKRSFRIINRIFVIDGSVAVGNAHCLFDFNDGVQRSVSEVTIRKAPRHDRFVLFTEGITVVERNGFIVDAATGKKAAIPPTHFTINGKRLFLLDGRLYALCAAREGMEIVEVK